MTPTFHRLAVASIAAASLVGTAAGATAQPGQAPVAYGESEPSTGSSGADTGSAAARTAGILAGNGDIIGLIVLLGVTPFQILTDGVCDMATGSSLPSPCVPGPAHYPG